MAQFREKEHPRDNDEKFKDKGASDRVNESKKDKKLSIHERWEQDSKTFTIMCKDGKRRTLKERRELRNKGFDI